MLLLALACVPADPGKPDDTDTPGDPTTDDTGTAPTWGDCPAPAGDEPWQTWDDGEGVASMEAFGGNGWTGYEGEYDFYETPSWESVRFELADPTCLYALAVAWDVAPTGDEVVGLYADFGWNGMDFHPDQPYWTTAAAGGETDEEGWTTYTISPPLRVEGPALVWAASWRDGEAGPTLLMDEGTAADGSCGTWDECHSSLNYPDADGRSYYNGTTFPLPYDFLARVQYGVLDTIAEEDRWFHDAGAGISTSHGAWGDYDDDGDDDLMVPGLSLYRNDGGVLTYVPEALSAGASGGVWGDYDNDGCLDFYGFTEDYTSPEVLLHNNCDGTFTNAIDGSGIDDRQTDVDCLEGDDPEYSATAGAAWIDYDNDGLLDLALANHICWANTRGTEDYYPDRFFHNEGDGTFVEWGEDRGFDWDGLATRGAMALDADLDGDVDLAMNNYRLGRNYYYRNGGDGTVEEVGKEVGLAGEASLYGSRTYYGHTIGLAWGDLDNDGDWDAIAANLAHPRFYGFSDKTNVLIGEDGAWTDLREERGVQYHETHSNPSLLDFENDGDLDLVITEVYDGRPTDVYVNDGAATFTGARREAGITTEGGWGSAVADFDGDGDEDLLATTLFRNDAATGHFVQLRLVGDVASNRAAIGAIAWVHGGGRTWMKTVPGGSGTGNQDSLTLTFGLGDVDTIDSVDVWFPGGGTVTYTGIAVDAGWRLTESGTVTEGLGAQ
ncbi:MAG: CRTAC1 family protein [Myxococcota bacterium]